MIISGYFCLLKQSEKRLLQEIVNKKKNTVYLSFAGLNLAFWVTLILVLVIKFFFFVMFNSFRSCCFKITAKL